MHCKASPYIVTKDVGSFRVLSKTAAKKVIQLLCWALKPFHALNTVTYVHVECGPPLVSSPDPTLSRGETFLAGKRAWAGHETSPPSPLPMPTAHTLLNHTSVQTGLRMGTS